MDPIEREMLVFGYMKKMEKTMDLFYEIPEGIYDLILLFYPRMFRFENINIAGVDISKNGLVVTKKEGIIVNLKFGEFLYASDAVIYEVVFDLKNVNKNTLSFGFMTPEFELPSDVMMRWNYGQNHSLTVNGNGYVCTSNEFKTTARHKSYIGDCHPDSPFWTDMDKLHVEIDMIKRIGSMWNGTNMYIFEVGLPESVAILMDWGGSEQTVSVISQQFRYS